MRHVRLVREKALARKHLERAQREADAWDVLYQRGESRPLEVVEALGLRARKLQRVTAALGRLVLRGAATVEVRRDLRTGLDHAYYRAR